MSTTPDQTQPEEWVVTYGDGQSRGLGSKEVAINRALEQLYKPGANVTGVKGPGGFVMTRAQLEEEAAKRAAKSK